MATHITILQDLTNPVDLIHFHPAFPLLTQRSDEFPDLNFNCFGESFQTVLHCLHFARFAPLDAAYADLFTLRSQQALRSVFEKTQTAMYGFVSSYPPLQQLQFMGSIDTFFKWKNAIVTNGTLERVRASEESFKSKLPTVLREILNARYSRFVGSLPEPVVFESAAYPTIARILTDLFVRRAVKVTSQPEASAYRLCALLAPRTAPVSALENGKENEKGTEKGKGKERDKEKAKEQEKEKETESLALHWSLMWSLEQKAEIQNRIKKLFRAVHTQFKPSSFTRAFGPSWIA
jgi:hypothetical protein